MLVWSPTTMLPYPSPVIFVCKQGHYECQVVSEGHDADDSLIQVVLKAAEDKHIMITYVVVVGSDSEDDFVKPPPNK